MRRTAIHIAALLLAAVVAGAAGAQGVRSLLKGTPAELFNEHDTKLMLDAAKQVLDGAPENEPVAWSNAETNHRGDVTLTRGFESQGRPCKELRVRNEAGNRTGESRVSACQVDGRWRLVSSSQVK
jgi:surface antigen